MSTRSPAVARAVDLELAVGRVRIRLGLRVAWLSHLRTQGHSDIEIASADLDRLEDEAAWRAETTPRELLDGLEEAERSLRDSDGRLTHLATLFGLSAAEQDLVQVCLAAALDERIARQFGLLNSHDDRRFPTEASAARLCDWDLPSILSAESPLRLWGLIRTEASYPGEPEALRLDPGIAAWLQGVDELDSLLVGAAYRMAAPAQLSTWPVAAVAEQLAPPSPGEQPNPTRVVVIGAAGSGRRSFASTLCEALGLGTLVVDSDRVPPGEWGATFAAAQRQAFLDRCAIVWVGAAALGLPWRTTGALFPVQMVVTEPGSAPPSIDDLVDVPVELPAPSIADRDYLWRTLVPPSNDWPAAERADLVERPHVTVADIVHVGRLRPSTAHDAVELLRGRSRGRVGSLATPMPLPYGRADLVLPPRIGEALDMLLFECRERRTFWEGESAARLFPHSGLVALLAGPPGVGKTMAAQVIASELGVDLLRVNLAETISKYIGETAKNLDAVLREAAAVDAVLLCDEADTLFGQRTEIKDAHDRWANADTNFLLQAIEDYPGVALLATNRRDQLDEAFLRRLRHVIDLPKPDRDARRTLWRALMADIAPGADLDALAPLTDRLADRVECTGAEIKHAVMNAAFAARHRHSVIEATDVLAGLDRELAKEGRSMSDLERRKVLHD